MGIEYYYVDVGELSLMITMPPFMITKYKVAYTQQSETGDREGESGKHHCRNGHLL